MKWLWNLITKKRRDVALAVLALVILPVAVQLLAEVIR